MRLKTVAAFVGGICLGVLIASVAGCVKWRAPENIVRESSRPGESR